MAKSDNEKRDYHQETTDKVIATLERAVALKWQTPWYLSPPEAPFNLETETIYAGINRITTSLAGFSDPRWLTFNGVRSYAARNELELKIRKGEHGTLIYKALAKVITEDKNGNPLEKPWNFVTMIPAGVVFNAQQIDGMPLYEKQQRRELKPFLAAEELLTALKTRTKLEYIEGTNGAWYSSATHTVGMPHRDTFKSDVSHYDTLLHELGHSTGPALNRKMGNVKGGEDYAYEELIAELSSCFMATELGIEHDQYAHEQHAAYIQSWLKALKGDKKFIFRASNAASRAANFQMEHLREHLYEQSLNKTATEEQQNMLAMFGIPQRVAKEIEAEKAQISVQDTTQEEALVIEVAPQVLEIETLPMAPTIKHEQRRSMGMRM